MVSSSITGSSAGDKAMNSHSGKHASSGLFSAKVQSPRGVESAATRIPKAIILVTNVSNHRRNRSVQHVQCRKHGPTYG